MTEAEAGDIQVSIRPDGWHIARADRRVLISHELVDSLSRGDSHGGTSEARIIDGVLHIDALNCSVTYRVDESPANGYHNAELVERIDHDTPEDGAS